MISAEMPASPEPTPPSAVTLDALSDTLLMEKQLVQELIAVMLRQRTAVAIDDIQSVDDTVFATHRLLLTLGEARQRRRSLTHLLGYPENMSLRDLEQHLGAHITPQLHTARTELRDAAQQLSREIAINRRILREALAHSESFVRTMRGGDAAIANAPVYGSTGVASFPPTATASFTRTV